MQTVLNRTSALAISSREFSEETKEVQRLKAEIGEIPSDTSSVGSEIDFLRHWCFTSIQSRDHQKRDGSASAGTSAEMRVSNKLTLGKVLTPGRSE